MKKRSRVFLFGALILVLLVAGCAGQEGTSTPIGTKPPGEGDLTSSPTPLETETPGTVVTDTTATTEVTKTATEGATATPTADATKQTPVVPVTGKVDVNVVECQFCIDTMAFALLEMPAAASLEIIDPASPDPDTVCNVVDTFQDRQVVLCRAPEETSVTVNVCTDANTCADITVELQTCPDKAGTPQPGGATNTPTPGADTSTATPEASPTATADTGLPTSTPTP
jgi:hypothetical protein